VYVSFIGTSLRFVPGCNGVNPCYITDIRYIQVLKFIKLLVLNFLSLIFTLSVYLDHDQCSISMCTLIIGHLLYTLVSVVGLLIIHRSLTSIS
jgi:hypothetical protein